MSDILLKLMAATSFATQDTTPNQFSFTDVTDVAVSTTQTSNTITLSGIDSGATANVSITGGTYSKNSGAYTSSAGTAQDGDTFSVRHTSSSSNLTSVNTTLTVDTVSDTFTSTTEAAATDVTPNAVNWNNISSGGSNASTNTQTISGINTTITLRVTYTRDDEAYTLITYVNGTSVGGAQAPSNYTFTVSNGDTVYFQAVGGETDDSSATVTNVSDGNAVLDTFGIDLNN
jgi:hypothetical protein